jgi:transmembrane sensor
MKDSAPIGSNPGDEQAFRAAYLIAGFIRNSLTEAEKDELDDWVVANMDNQRIFEKLTNKKNIDAWIKERQGIDTVTALERIKTKISFGPPRKKPIVAPVWIYAAAASVLLGLMFLILYLSKTNIPKPPDIVITKPADINPGMDKAILTLSDGTKIKLDTVKNGNLVSQGNTNITKNDSGGLAYQLIRPSTLPQVELFNELTVPAGGQYNVVLPDGTKVWLNASSSLKYPTVFGGAKRQVELTGEGYFEVAKDPMFPFEVSVNGSTVQVLGTHFNINAYTDEPVTNITLAQGSIKLNNLMLLKPGENAAVSKNGNMLKGGADIEMVFAWKNGQFVFKDTPIDVLMRQVARWYNANIIYDATIPKHFNATIPRATPVSKLLHILEVTNEVHFKIEGNQITVMK